MNIKKQKQNELMICSFYGEINIDTVEKVKDFFKKLLNSDEKKIVLDFEKLDYIDSSGLASLIEYAKLLSQTQGKLCLVQIPPKIQSILTITKLDKIFPIFNTSEEAKKEFFDKE